jgi:hypothetical protein
MNANGVDSGSMCGFQTRLGDVVVLKNVQPGTAAE